MGNGSEDTVKHHRVEFSVEVDPFTGGATARIPIPTTPGRGLTPALALVHGGGGNSEVGLGWHLAGLPRIAIDRSERAPRWDGSDGVALDGVPLVPWLDDGVPRTRSEGDWRVAVLRPRHGFTAVAVEEWRLAGTNDVHYRSRDAAGVVTVFGARGAATRIADETDPSRVLEWLPEVQLDLEGNALWFDYVAETLEAVDRTAPWEPRRPSTAQRYLASVRYGNTLPIKLDARVLAGEEPELRWCFHLVLDRGDHGDDDGVPRFARDVVWPARADAFVVTRDGIELRTYRRLQRIVCFHDLPALAAGPAAVSAFELAYQDDGAGARLTTVRRVGYRGGVARATQPLTVRYSTPGIENAARPVRVDDLGAAGPPGGGRETLVDLYGEGLPGLLFQGDRGWVYRANRGGGRFAEAVTVGERPSLAAIGSLGDLDRDGDPELAIVVGRQAGAFELDREDARWSGFRPFAALPHVEAAVGRTFWVDLNGDGRADVVVAHGDALLWFPSRSGALDEDGPEFDEPVRITRPDRGDAAPLCGPDGRLDLFFADMNGDGMPDLVQVGNGSVVYWPSLGNGRFGERVAMDGAPVLAGFEVFDARRVRLVDLQGTGASDLLYLGDGEIVHHPNAGGRGFLPPRRIAALPQLGDAGTVTIADVAGDGRPCLVWSAALPGRAHTMQYLPLVPEVPPGRLAAIDDGLGREIQLRWGSSATHYLRDREAGSPWSTRLPQHRAVVDARVTIDQIGGTRLTTRYRYRDGYFDGPVGALRGFGRVDMIDTEAAGDDDVGFAAPLLTRTWFHLGTPMWNHHRPHEPYAGDALAPRLPPHVGPAMSLGVADSAEALRGLAGAVVRRERWAIDADEQLGPHPIDVAQQVMRVVCVQPRLGAIRPVFAIAPEEQLTAIHEQAAGDPRVTHEVTLAIDAWGAPVRTASIAYPRRAGADVPEQARRRIAITEHVRANVDEPTRLLLGLPIATTMFELVGVVPDGDRITPARLRAADVEAALASPWPFDHALDPDANAPAARRLGWQRTFYWNDAGDRALALGEVGLRGRPHHTEDACFTAELLAAAFAERVDAAMLEQLGYTFDGSLWWRASVVQQYGELGVIAGSVRGDGATTSLVHDADHLVVIASIDAVGLQTSFEPDPVTLQPLRSIDPNGNVAEVTYDPLGVAVRTSRRGMCAGKTWGFEPLVGELPPAVDLAGLLADPGAYLGPAATAIWVDAAAWSRDGTPPVLVELARTSLTHDGEQGPADGPIEVALTYLDGFGRPLQRKAAVAAGPAITRGPDGAVVVEDDEPVEAWAEARWRVSGHVVHDAKGRPGQVFDPYFSPSAAYESDDVLQRFGVATLTRYDAAGRVARVDLPNGTFATITYTPWSSEQASAGDNVLASTYRILRESLPADDAERVAYEEARAHAGSTRTSFVDVRGLPCGTLERGDLDTLDRLTVLRLDAAGRATDVIDPRGLVAFHHVHDMLGRALLDASVDAGTRRALLDAYDRPVRGWDARGFAVERGFDLADRPTYTHVRGGDGIVPLDHRVEERIYGDASGDLGGALEANALGRVIVVRDAGGERRTRTYDPDGGVRDAELRVRSDADDTADWSGAVALESESLQLHTVHDALGRPLRAQLADGTWRTHLYARGGELVRVQITSPDGALTETPVLAAAAHDAHGRPSAATLGNDVALAWQYDRETGRLARLDAVRGARVLQALRYTHDADGRVVRMLDLAQEGSGALVPGAVTARRDFGYDGHGRLIRATGRVHQALLPHDYIPGTGGTMQGTRHLSLDNGAALERYTQTFEYDRSGNLLALRHAGATRSWATTLWVDSASNRAAPALDPNGNPVTDPAAQFDAGGNTVQLAHLRAMRWSWRGCLEWAVTVARPGGPVDDHESYGHGADGQRTRKRATRLVVGGAAPVIETRDVVYVGDQERVQVRRNGTLVLERWTTHVRDGERRVAIVDRHTVDTLAAEVDTVGGARVRYQLTTPQGSTAVELDADGRLISYEEYFPHGGTALVAGDDVREVARRDVRYCGKTRDDATGLYAYPYRSYAPWLGRWLSPDPIGPADDLNLYQFVGGDPIGFVDPQGTDKRRAEPVESRLTLEATGDPALYGIVDASGTLVGWEIYDHEAGRWDVVSSTPLVVELDGEYESRYGAFHEYTIEGGAFIDTITSGDGSRWGAKGHAQFRTVDDVAGRQYQVYARVGEGKDLTWGWQDVDFERFDYFRNVNFAYEHGDASWTALAEDAKVSNPTAYFTSVLADDARKVEQFAGLFAGAKNEMDFQSGRLYAAVDIVRDLVMVGKNGKVATSVAANGLDKRPHQGPGELLHSLNPVYQVLVNSYEATNAAERGDHFEAGRRTTLATLAIADTVFLADGLARTLTRVGGRLARPGAPPPPTPQTRMPAGHVDEAAGAEFLDDAIRTKDHPVAEQVDGVPKTGESRSGVIQPLLETAPEELLEALFEAHTKNTGGGVLATVDHNGIVDLVIKRSPGTPSGGDMFREAIAYFGNRVKGVRGTWLGRRDLADNFSSFVAAMRAGESAESAAFMTFTGKMARRAGFDRVKILQLGDLKIVVEFTR